MNHEVILQSCFDAIERLDVPHVAKVDLLVPLHTLKPGPLEILFDLGLESGLSIKDTIQRAGTVYFAFCCGHLADDLSDNDCHYLDNLGPCTQLDLLNLFYLGILDAELPKTVIRSVIVELLSAVGQQHVELRTKSWTSEIYRNVADIAARQWTAYLQIMWFGTPLVNSAFEVGKNVAIAAHVTKDIACSDRRFIGLTQGDRAEVLLWALEASKIARSHRVRAFDSVLDRADMGLTAALSNLFIPGSFKDDII